MRVDLAHALIDGARGGDKAAFMQLVGPVLPQAFRLASAMLRSETDAEDAVQDAVLNAWRHIERLKPGSRVDPWFLTIVANQCRSYRRSRWWSVVRGVNLPERAAMGGGLDADTLDLRKALYRLPEDQRLVLVLRYYLDLPLEEVAATLGISSKAARSRVHRALARLRLLPEVLGDE